MMPVSHFHVYMQVRQVLHYSFKSLCRSLRGVTKKIKLIIQSTFHLCYILPDNFQKQLQTGCTAIIYQAHSKVRSSIRYILYWKLQDVLLIFYISINGCVPHLVSQQFLCVKSKFMPITSLPKLIQIVIDCALHIATCLQHASGLEDCYILQIKLHVVYMLFSLLKKPFAKHQSMQTFK